MARKSKKSTALDVRTPKDIPMFEKLLSKGPMAMVLVYADWCGYCTQFKDKVWNDSTLSKTKNLNTAAVHYDMLDQTSLKNTPVKGYPSMFLVGNDKEAKEIPTPQSGEELLKLDNTSANVLKNSNLNSGNLNSGNLNSGNLNNITVKNNNSQELLSNEIIETEPLANNNSYSPMPPNALEDVVNKPESDETISQAGGSLYDVLTRYNEEFTARQQGGKRRRKTSKRKNRRALTRRR